MRKVTRALMVPAFVCAAAMAQESPSILGNTDLRGLIEAAPTMPATPDEAWVKSYGPDRTKQNPDQIKATFDPFFQRAKDAHRQLAGAIKARKKQNEAAAKRQAEANPILAGAGGTDKLKAMTRDQQQQAIQHSAAQNIGAMGGPGMQAMLEKMMSDPEYKARFSRMSDAEKQAEFQKNSNSGPPTADQQKARQQAEQSRQGGIDAKAAMDLQAEIRQMSQRASTIDAGFAQQDNEITTAPGSHADIAKDIEAKIGKLPLVDMGELGEKVPDPKKAEALKKEQINRDRDRATWELQQRTALYARRKAQYQELANSYGTWLKQNLGRINDHGPQLGSSIEITVAEYEDDLIKLSENLANYSLGATKDAAEYERTYRNGLAESQPATTSRRNKATKAQQ